ncbi:MAG: amidase [Burkholderiaceae bacterium]
MPLDNLPYAQITDLAAAYRQKKLSPVDVTQLMIERIARLEPALHAYLTLTPEIALEQARQAEAEMQRGEFRGPMHGVPIGIKDLCETAGVRTTWGSVILQDHVPERNATVIDKLFAAGAIMLGKLHMTEGAYSVHHPSLPVPVNPWHADHWSGASSSGSGVATAAGLCYGSIGTDTGGSIRFPSGANGVTGLKPTWGRVSRHGVLALADSLDHVGPMTRSAADCGAMLGAMAGVDPNDPTTLEAAVPDYLQGIETGIRGVRIGVDPAYLSVCTPDTLRVIDEARRVLGDLGATLTEVAMPATTSAMAVEWARLCGAETAIAHERYYPARAAEYGPVLASLIEMGRAATGIEIMKIEQARLAFKGALRKLFEQVDLLLVPVHPFGNPSGAELDRYLSSPEGIDNLLRYTAPFDMSGSPTLTMPGGFADKGDQTDKGLPIGFQLVGRHLDEPLLVRAGHAYQRVTDWHRRHPEG